MFLEKSNEDSLRIREDALYIQEKDLEDALKTIEQENYKTSVALGFIGVILVQSLQFASDGPLWWSVIYLGLLMLAAATGFYNLLSKKIAVHTNVDEIFVRKEAFRSWSDYLDLKHLRLAEAYRDAKKLVGHKASLTKITFALVVFSLLILAVGVLTWQKSVK